MRLFLCCLCLCYLGFSSIVTASDKNKKPNKRAGLKQATQKVCCSTPEMKKSLDEARKHSHFQVELKQQKKKFWSYTRVNLQRQTLYAHIIVPILRAYKVPEELILLAAAESSYKARVLSPSDASGVWQFIPRTGRRFGLRMTPWVDERRHIRKATVAAARYLRFLYKRYKQWEFAVASYNCGESMMDRIRRRCPGMSMWDILTTPKCKMPAETKHYVARIFSLIHYSYTPTAFRRKMSPQRTYRLTSVNIKKPISLLQLSHFTGIPLKTLWKDNAELSSWTTPPRKKYKLLVKRSHVPLVKEFLKSKQPYKLKLVTLRNSTRLSKIASKYGMPEHVLQLFNHIQAKKKKIRLRRLLVPIPKKGKWTFLLQPQLLSLIKKVKGFFANNKEVYLAQKGKHPFPFHCPECIFTRPTVEHLPLATFQGIHYQKTSAWTRVVLRFDRRIQIEEGSAEENLVLQLPKRIYLDIAPCKIHRWYLKKAFTVNSLRLQRVRIGRTGRSVRFVFELAHEQKTRITLLTNPMRIVVDIGKETFPSVPTKSLRVPKKKALRLEGKRLKAWKHFWYPSR